MNGNKICSHNKITNSNTEVDFKLLSPSMIMKLKSSTEAHNTEPSTDYKSTINKLFIDMESCNQYMAFIVDDYFETHCTIVINFNCNCYASISLNFT